MTKEAKKTNIKTSANSDMNIEKVIAAVNKNNGNITGAAKSLRCEKWHLYKMIEAHPELKNVISKARESIIDEAEKSLLKNIQGGNVSSIIFVLKTLGRSRGYVINGYKPNELTSRINQTVLKRLTDDQLAELETLLKKKKDLTSFLEEIGLYASPD